MGTPLALATKIPSVFVRRQACLIPATDEDILPFAPINAIRLGRIEEGQARGLAIRIVGQSRKSCQQRLRAVLARSRARFLGKDKLASRKKSWAEERRQTMTLT
jgi:hypothetical protein